MVGRWMQSAYHCSSLHPGSSPPSGRGGEHPATTVFRRPWQIAYATVSGRRPLLRVPAFLLHLVDPGAEAASAAAHVSAASEPGFVVPLHTDAWAARKLAPQIAASTTREAQRAASSRFRYLQPDSRRSPRQRAPSSFSRRSTYARRAEGTRHAERDSASRRPRTGARSTVQPTTSRKNAARTASA